MTGVHQSNWYLLSICQKTKPNAGVNVGFGFFANYSLQGGI